MLNKAGMEQLWALGWLHVPLWLSEIESESALAPQILKGQPHMLPGFNMRWIHFKAIYEATY